MKLHFEDNLDYQMTAIEAVADLFRGQDINRTEFTVSKLVDPSGQTTLPGMEESTLGIGNRLQLLDDEILERYFSGLEYDLDPVKLKGLEEFYAKLYHCDLIPEPVRINFSGLDQVDESQGTSDGFQNLVPTIAAN